jgi:dihydrofolate reductase
LQVSARRVHEGAAVRKVVAGLYMSLDGVVEAPTAWHRQYLDDEVLAGIAEGVAKADAVLLGRRTYALFSQIWPQQGDASSMARFLNTAPKYVVSSTDVSLDWANSHRLTGDLATELAGLRGQAGQDILIPGSPRLVRSLLRDGLLDELSLDIMPVVVGEGTRLFAGLADLQLDLVSSEAFGNGVLGVTYRCA